MTNNDQPLTPSRTLRGRSDAARAHQTRLAQLRNENSARVANWLRDQDTVTIADIAEATGLSKPTVKERLVDLTILGVVTPAGTMNSKEQGSGRPASQYRFNPDHAHVLGVELGPSVDRIGVANLGGRIIVQIEQPATTGTADVRLDALIAAADTRLAETGQIIRHVTAVTIASSDPTSDQLRDGRYAFPVRYETHIDAAAIAERLMGAATNAATFLLAERENELRISLVVDGSVNRGAHRRAGDFSQLTSLTNPDDQLALTVIAFDPEVVFVGVNDVAAAAKTIRHRVKGTDPIPVRATALGSDGATIGAMLLSVKDATLRLLGPAGEQPTRLHS
jgi:predicted transcriptional regulator